MRTIKSPKMTAYKRLLDRRRIVILSRKLTELYLYSKMYGCDDFNESLVQIYEDIFPGMKGKVTMKYVDEYVELYNNDPTIKRGLMLKLSRESANINAKDIYKEMGINSSEYYNLENGLYELTGKWLERVEEAEQLVRKFKEKTKEE